MPQCIIDSLIAGLSQFLQFGTCAAHFTIICVVLWSEYVEKSETGHKDGYGSSLLHPPGHLSTALCSAHIKKNIT